MQGLIGWVQKAPEQALGILGGALLLLLALSTISLIRFGSLARQQQRLLTGIQSGDLEKLLADCLSENQRLWTQLEVRRKAEEVLGQRMNSALQGVGLVRYDAVANTGGQQSFSLALLDATGEGVVVSGLQTRAEMRMYAKPVAGGSSPLTLTDEEKQAIAQANRSKG